MGRYCRIEWKNVDGQVCRVHVDYETGVIEARVEYEIS